MAKKLILPGDNRMAKMQGSKKRSPSQSWLYDIVKRIKTDPESRARGVNIDKTLTKCVKML